jgi:hypothetical protein
MHLLGCGRFGRKANRGPSFIRDDARNDDMSSDRENGPEMSPAEELTDPAATLVATMTTAVERLRHLAVTALCADAALFDDTTHDDRT